MHDFPSEGDLVSFFKGHRGHVRAQSHVSAQKMAITFIRGPDHVHLEIDRALNHLAIRWYQGGHPSINVSLMNLSAVRTVTENRDHYLCATGNSKEGMETVRLSLCPRISIDVTCTT